MTLRIITTQKDTGLIEGLFKVPLSLNKIPHKFHTKLPPPDECDPQDVVFVLGGALCKELQALGLARKGSTINSMRGTVIDYGGIRAMVSFDPAITRIDAARKPDMEWDIQLICRLYCQGSLDPVIGKYRWVEDFQDVVDFVLSETQDKHIVMSLDLETIGLDPWSRGDDETPPARIVTVALTYTLGTALVYKVPECGIPKDSFIASLKWLVHHPKVKLVGANLKFDWVWLKQHWDVEISNQKFDTTLVGSLLDENRSNSLNRHAKIYTTMGGYDDEFNDKHDKGRMDLIPDEDLLPYAGGDTDAVLRAYPPMRKELLRNKRLTNLYVNLIQPASRVFAKMEHRGVCVDQSKYDELEVAVRAEIADRTKDLIDLLPGRIISKHKDNLSMTRPVILKDYLFSNAGLNLKPELFTEKSKQPQTTVEHLEVLQTSNPDNEELALFIDAMGKMRSAGKTLTTYITGFRKHIRSDGKFHPTYMLYKGGYGNDDDESGTVTGRTSAKDPAWQTMPKHTIWAKPLRSVYIPPPGMAILKLDFSQGELRVIACVADETTMIDAYKSGTDLHAITAALLNKMPFETFMQQDPDWIAHKRFGGKAGNFGLIYGMSAGGFVVYARNTYGVEIPLAEANEFKEAFFNRYPMLPIYHDKYREFAHEHLYVNNPMGRVRNLPLINSNDSKVRSTSERQSINSPIQSCLSDICLLAMVEIDREYPDLWMFGNTHDELQFYVPEDEIAVWAERIKDVMENVPIHKFGWQPQLKFPVDAEASNVNLAECMDLDKFLKQAA